MNSWVILLFLVLFVWSAKYIFAAGKREGSRKGYGVGFDRGRRSAGCLILLGCLVGFLGAVIGCSCSVATASVNPQAAAIQQAVDQDADFTLRYGPANNVAMLSSWAPNYAGQLRTIDLRGCPSDFAEAYMRHVQLWEEIGNWAPKDPSFLQAMSILLFSNVAGDFAEFEQRLSDSWQEIELIALRHGVQVPPKRFTISAMYEASPEPN